ncbi:MAG: ABC transporter permease [Armatimonadetes bacterium]|nr:ABC transporter permease [Armatimonadota bacterium]
MKRFLITSVVLLATISLVFAIFQMPMWPSLQLTAQGAFGDRFGITRTLVKTIPLLTAGLGMVIAWRAGAYNIGGEGQFIIGSVAGAWMAKTMMSLGSVGAAASYAVLAVCVLGGAMYAALAGWISFRRGLSPVIVTILLNFVASQVLDYAVRGPLQEDTHAVPLTQTLPQSMMLARFDPQLDLHSGIYITIAAMLAAQVFLFRTRKGFQIRLVGASPQAARSAGLNEVRLKLLAMALSGGLCGLAGGLEYLGLAGQIGVSSSQNWGFLAIPVAVLGGLTPLGCGLSALFFGSLFAGSQQLARFSNSGSTLIYVMQGLAVLAFVMIEARNKRLEPAGEV